MTRSIINFASDGILVYGVRAGELIVTVGGGGGGGGGGGALGMFVK